MTPHLELFEYLTMELAYGWPAGVIIGAVATRAFLYIPKYWIYVILSIFYREKELEI